MRELRRPISDGNVVNLFPNIAIKQQKQLDFNKKKKKNQREQGDERTEEADFRWQCSQFVAKYSNKTTKTIDFNKKKK